MTEHDAPRIRVRVNHKRTVKSGWEPSETTVEIEWRNCSERLMTRPNGEAFLVTSPMLNGGEDVTPFADALRVLMGQAYREAWAEAEVRNTLEHERNGSG